MRTAYLLMLVGIGAGVIQAADTPPGALLVLEKSQNTLVIVDPVSLKIVARVPVGAQPHEVAVSDDGKTAYVSNTNGENRFIGYDGTSTIAVIDLVGQKPLTPISLGALRTPHGMTFADGKLYFTAEGAKAVCRYDPATGKIDWIMGTGEDSTHMVLVSRDFKTVFTSNVRSATVSIIQLVPGTPIGRQKGGPPPIDWNVTNVPVGHGSEGFDVSPDGKELWVANSRDQTISIIDVVGRKTIQTLPSPAMAANRLKFSRDGKYVFVSDLRGMDLLVYDATTRKEYKRIPLDGNSEGLVVAPDGTHVYTTLNSRDSVAVIDLKTMTVTGKLETGKGPDGLAWAQRQ